MTFDDESFLNAAFIDCAKTLGQIPTVDEFRTHLGLLYLSSPSEPFFQKFPSVLAIPLDGFLKNLEIEDCASLEVAKKVDYARFNLNERKYVDGTM